MKIFELLSILAGVAAILHIAYNLITGKEDLEEAAASAEAVVDASTAEVKAVEAAVETPPAPPAAS